MQYKKIEKDHRFGKLTCMERLELGGFGGANWRCKCECGKTIEVSEAMLLSGVVRNCGCRKTRAINLKGQCFGMLTVLEPVPERAKDGSVCWLCRCECGRYITQSSNKLLMGRRISCGCQATVSAQESKTYIDGTCVEIMLSDTISKNNTSGYRGVAKKRDKWQAYINYGGKRISLGSFETKELAAEARRTAEQRIREHLTGLLNETTNSMEVDIYMENRDLFEELKRLVRCEYISDLRYAPWLDRARKTIAEMNLSIYPLVTLNDAADYLYSEKPDFASNEAAQEYFKKRVLSDI